MQQRFSLGIDLGTSNSAIALSEVDSDQTNIIEITQVLGPNQIGEKPTLPSALYIPHPDEFPEGAFPLPWAGDARPSAFSPAITARCSGPSGYISKVMAVEPAYRSPALQIEPELWMRDGDRIFVL